MIRIIDGTTEESLTSVHKAIGALATGKGFVGNPTTMLSSAPEENLDQEDRNQVNVIQGPQILTEADIGEVAYSPCEQMLTPLDSEFKTPRHPHQPLV